MAIRRSWHATQSIVWSLIVTVALAASACAADKASPRRKILLVGQQRDNHPVTTHEFLPGLRVLEACLKQNPAVEVTICRSRRRLGRWP